MQSFIVLGIIPGTHIQTTLNFWIAVSVILCLLALRSPVRSGRRKFTHYLLARRIARTIEHCELVANIY